MSNNTHPNVANPASDCCTAATPSPTGGQAAKFVPAADIYETAEAVMLELDLPGARPESVNVSFEKNTLRIEAEAGPSELHGTDATPLLSEFETGHYQRAFEVSDEIDADGISAQFKHGVLTLTLPKAAPVSRKVNVNIARA